MKPAEGKMPLLRISILLIMLQCSYSLGSDDYPVFCQNSYQVTVNETYTTEDYTRPEKGFITVSCNCFNTTADLVYSLIIDEETPVNIDPVTGELEVTDDLDYENVMSGSLTFTAVCSAENNTLNDTAVIVINLLPVNEFLPTIQSVRTLISMTENNLPEPGILDSTLPGVAYTVSDMDLPAQTIFYTLTDGDHEGFEFNETLGGIVLLDTFDLDNRSKSCGPLIISFRITVCDTSPPLDTCPNVGITLLIRYSNDNTPSFTHVEDSVIVSEFIPVNSTLAGVTCTDEDICEGEFGGYDIVDENLTSTFYIDANGTLINLVPLDFENAAFHSVRVRCFDRVSDPSQQREAFTTIEIQVTDDNDTPECTSPATVDLETGIHNMTQVLRLSCTDEDTGLNGQLTYTIEGDNLTLSGNGAFIVNQTTGELFFDGELLSNDNYEVNISVADSGNTPVMTQIQIRITSTDPTTSEPTSEPTTEPTTSEPTTSEPTTSEPTTSEPTTSESITSEPTTSEPTTSESTTEPITSEPTTEPTTSESTTTEPTTSESTTSESTTEPIISEPTTSEPITSEPTTSEPTTSEPTTEPTTSDSKTTIFVAATEGVLPTDGGLPMVVIIVASVLGVSFLILCCLLILLLCCCSCYSKKSTRKEKKIYHVELAITTIPTVTTFTNENRDVNLYLDEDTATTSFKTLSSESSSSVNPNEYVISNTTVIINDKDPLGLVEAMSHEVDCLTETNSSDPQTESDHQEIHIESSCL